MKTKGRKFFSVLTAMLFAVTLGLGSVIMSPTSAYAEECFSKHAVGGAKVGMDALYHPVTKVLEPVKPVWPLYIPLQAANTVFSGFFVGVLGGGAVGSVVGALDSMTGCTSNK